MVFSTKVLSVLIAAGIIAGSHGTQTQDVENRGFRSSDFALHQISAPSDYAPDPRVKRLQADTDKMLMLLGFANVIAYEKPCRLDYDVNAVQAYVLNHFSDDDGRSMAMLDGLITSAQMQLLQQSRSAFSVQCAQATRFARENNFIP